MDSEFDKKYYKIREVSEILGVPATTLRFWENRFPQLKPRRSEHGGRRYVAADIELLRTINYLVKDKGLKIEAAVAQLQHNRSNVSRRQEVLERLQDIRSRLDAMLKSLSSRAQ